MKRSVIYGVFLFLLSGCQAFSAFFPMPTPLPPTALPTSTAQPSPTPTMPPPTLTPAPPLLLGRRVISTASTTPEAAFEVEYPAIENAGSPHLQAFNRASEKFANDLLNAFQKELEKSLGGSDPAFHPTFMKTTFQVSNGKHGLLSILFSVGYYWAGAAHPNQYAQVINFDLKTGQRLQLADVFTAESDYVAFISTLCIADLKRQDRLMFEAGAQPTAENFSNWNITPNGLQFTFDPYQVGPYVMGPSQVVLPFDTLKPIINPNGPLLPFIQAKTP